VVGRGLARSVGQEVRGGTGEVVGGLMFAAAATAGIALVGWLAGRGALPVFDGTGFVGTLPGWGGAALGAWMAAVALVSLALPATTLLVWGRRAAVRRAFLAYEVVLVVQISVEMVFSGVFSPDIVVLTGMVFTGYRLRQLYAARRRFVSVEVPSALGRAAVRLCLSLGLVLWSANLAFLVFVALPRVIRLG
jgi:hypothetical protein